MLLDRAAGGLIVRFEPDRCETSFVNIRILLPRRSLHCHPSAPTRPTQALAEYVS